MCIPNNLIQLKTFSNSHWNRRSLRSDLAEAYKMMKGMDRMDIQNPFPSVRESRTRGHRLTVRREKCKEDLRSECFKCHYLELRLELIII